MVLTFGKICRCLEKPGLGGFPPNPPLGDGAPPPDPLRKGYNVLTQILSLKYHITYYPLPITHYPLPITHYPLPITHY